jgi:hypothetical protein
MHAPAHKAFVAMAALLQPCHEWVMMTGSGRDGATFLAEFACRQFPVRSHLLLNCSRLGAFHVPNDPFVDNSNTGKLVCQRGAEVH